MLSSKQNNTSDKQGSGDISRPEELSYLSIKDPEKSPGRKGCWEDESMLMVHDESVTARYLWHHEEILKKKLKGKVAD